MPAVSTAMNLRLDRLGDISISCQELNDTTWKIAHINLIIGGIDGQVTHRGRFRNGSFPDFKTDSMVASQLFNVSEWRRDLLGEDKNWQYGAPPRGGVDTGRILFV